MSLRLLLETAAKIHLNEQQDQTYKKFLKNAKEQMGLGKEKENFLVITQSWLGSNNSLNAMLGIYAHTNILVDKSDIIQSSIIAGAIIEFYFKKQ